VRSLRSSLQTVLAQRVAAPERGGILAVLLDLPIAWHTATTFSLSALTLKRVEGLLCGYQFVGAWPSKVARFTDADSGKVVFQQSMPATCPACAVEAARHKCRRREYGGSTYRREHWSKFDPGT